MEIFFGKIWHLGFFHLIIFELAKDGVELDPGFVELVLEHIGPLEAGRSHCHNTCPPLLVQSIVFCLLLLPSQSTIVTCWKPLLVYCHLASVTWQTEQSSLAECNWNQLTCQRWAAALLSSCTDGGFQQVASAAAHLSECHLHAMAASRPTPCNQPLQRINLCNRVQSKPVKSLDALWDTLLPVIRVQNNFQPWHKFPFQHRRLFACEHLATSLHCHAPPHHHRWQPTFFQSNATMQCHNTHSRLLL